MKVKTGTGIKRAAIYLRMSSDPQKDSIAQQREACLLYASDHGYTVVGEYADEAISGISSRHKRSGFQHLVTDAELGQFEFVICWEQNRASRSKPREFFAEMNPLADVGVKLVFTNKGMIDLDKFTDFLQSACDANSSNEYVTSMARSVVRGQHQKKAQHGKWVSGTPPFGLNYIRTDPKVDPNAGDIILGDPVDIETVGLMFGWYLEGYSDRSIVKKLQDERGLKKTQRFVQKALTNPFYAGDYRWNANSNARFFALRGGRVTDDFNTGKTGDDDMVFITNNHPAIIDRETFTSVQLRRAERRTKTTPFRSGGPHLLTGLCRCKKCGKKFSGHRYKDRVALSCNGYREGVCTGNYVNQHEIVADIVASFDKFLSDEHVAELRREYADAITDQRGKIDPAAIRQELQKRKDKYHQLREQVRRFPDLLEDFAEPLREDKSEIGRLQAQLANMESDDDNHVIQFDAHVAKLTDIVTELKAAVMEITDTHPHLVRELLASMIESIELDVHDRGEKRNPRFRLDEGEITLKPGFNLTPAY